MAAALAFIVPRIIETRQQLTSRGQNSFVCPSPPTWMSAFDAEASVTPSAAPVSLRATELLTSASTRRDHENALPCDTRPHAVCDRAEHTVQLVEDITGLTGASGLVLTLRENAEPVRITRAQVRLGVHAKHGYGRPILLRSP